MTLYAVDFGPTADLLDQGIASAVTETGGLMFFCQYPGPTTGGRPIYDGRFNMTERRAISEENVER